MGHAGAAVAVISLVVSTAFLIWVSEKQGSPHQKFGKAIAWVAIVISTLTIVGSAVMCARMCVSGMCSMGREKGGMMMPHRMPMGTGTSPHGMGMMEGQGGMGKAMESGEAGPARPPSK